MDNKKELMPRKNKNQKIGYGILMLVVFVSGIVLLQNKQESENISYQAPVIKSKSGTIYPSQYSDKNITSNAIMAEPKFRSLSIFDRKALLANTISSISKNPSSDLYSGPEKGTWLWTPVLEQTEKYQNTIIEGAKKDGIKNIYLSIDSYLDIFVMEDGAEKNELRSKFDAKIESFIKLANKNGIVVDAEAGWRNWAEDGHSYKAFAVVEYAKEYNKTHSAKFRGFQYDVEPYLLDSYQKDKARVLTNFLDLVGETVSRLSGSDLEFSVVIPEFYDGTNSETPVFAYGGYDGFAIDHLLRVLDRRKGSKIIIMSYRNFSRGNDGSIDVSKDEILRANKRDTKIVIAQETGDVPPSYITFYNTSKKYFDKQLALLQKAFDEEKSFGGVAIHYANAFFELK